MSLKMKLLSAVLAFGFVSAEALAQRGPGGGRGGRDHYDDSRYDRRPDRRNGSERQSAFIARQLAFSARQLAQQVQREAGYRQQQAVHMTQRLSMDAQQLAQTVARYDDQNPRVRQEMDRFVRNLNAVTNQLRRAGFSYHVQRMQQDLKQDARYLRSELMRNDRYPDRGRGLSKAEKIIGVIGAIAIIADIID